MGRWSQALVVLLALHQSSCEAFVVPTTVWTHTTTRCNSMTTGGYMDSLSRKNPEEDGPRNAGVPGPDHNSLGKPAEDHHVAPMKGSASNEAVVFESNNGAAESNGIVQEAALNEEPELLFEPKPPDTEPPVALLLKEEEEFDKAVQDALKYFLESVTADQMLEEASVEADAKLEAMSHTDVASSNDIPRVDRVEDVNDVVSDALKFFEDNVATLDHEAAKDTHDAKHQTADEFVADHDDDSNKQPFFLKKSDKIANMEQKIAKLEAEAEQKARLDNHKKKKNGRRSNKDNNTHVDPGRVELYNEKSNKIQKMEQKIAMMEAEAQERTRQLELELEEKLNDYQALIDKEVNNMNKMLKVELRLEEQREAEIQELVSFVQDAMEHKEEDIEYNEGIANHMAKIRNKLEPGAGATKMEQLEEEKRTVASIERGHLDTLKQCLQELQIVLQEARDRADRTKEAVRNFVPPETNQMSHSWTDMDHMEQVLGEASLHVIDSEAKLQLLRQRIDEALPKEVTLAAIKKKMLSTAVKQATEGALAHKTHDVVDLVELRDKDEAYLLGVLGSSLGKTAGGAVKAAVLGLKAVFDTVTDSEVSEATNQVIAKSKGVSLASTEKRQATGEVLGALTKTGMTLFHQVGKKESAHGATTALKETTQDLLSTLNAASVLTIKYLKKKQNRQKQPNDEP